ncbi:hypothetical protein OIDMADRAFT_135607 [Neofusicoccum parvum]|uniref:Uncharacterized protein n=1 Tax=Neofusicoccum parvum TaxID=310453 RepID=A0ACB5SEL1_9PEZI|nr:hypothetical protein OIDMADRAFT_135607 [Neofusicoccum parvum]
MLWSAIGDSVGRRPLYLATLTIYLGACLGLSLCSTYASVVVLRALQAAGSASTTAIGAGLIGDLVHTSRRGQFMGNYSALAGFATAFGPVLGGVFAQYTGWHGIFFFLLGLAASLLALVALLVPETMRSIVGDGSVAPPRYLRPPLLWLDAPKPPTTEAQSLPRKPFKVDIVATLRLLMEPEVLCSVMFTGVCYTVWQMSMVATATLYSERYGLSELYIGLTYISNGTGSLCASVLTGKVLNLEYARQLAREKEQLGGHVREVQHIERARIRPMIIPTVLFIASVVAFGWVIEYHVHIAVSITLAFLVGGLDTCILATFSLKATLVIDLFQRQSFSVTACLNLSRCLVAAAGTAAIQPMIRAIGVGWAFTFTLSSMFIVRNLACAFPSIGTTSYTMASQTEKDTVNSAEEGLDVQNDPSDDVAKGETLKIAVDIVQAEHQYTDEQYAALLRKIDWWLLPLMWVCYGTQQADKTSIATQATLGLREDTHLVGQQFSWLTTVFYLSYLAFSFPGNFIMQRVHLGRTLALCMFFWGLIVLCIAFSTNFATLATLRSLQGLFECTISPAFLLITGSFYTAREHTMRAIIWGTANAGMGVLTELINYGIGRHAEAHAGGVAAWKGVSFFLGALTVVLSGLAFAVLGTPREVRWLSGEEKRMAVARVVRNQTGSDGQKRPEWKWDQVRTTFRDPQTYFFFFTTLANSLPNGGTTSFGNLVYVSFGFSSLDTIVKGRLPQNLVSIAWFLFVGMMTLRKPNMRFFFMMISVIPSFVGMLVLALLPKDGLLWTRWGMYLMTVTGNVTGLLIWTLLPSNVAGRTKKSVTSTILFVAYCAGNAAGAQVFRAKDAPRYIPAITVCSAMYGLQFVLMGAWCTYCRKTNQYRDKILAERGVSAEESAFEGRLNAENDMTDFENVHFRYSF